MSAVTCGIGDDCLWDTKYLEVQKCRVLLAACIAVIMIIQWMRHRRMKLSVVNKIFVFISVHLISDVVVSVDFVRFLKSFCHFSLFFSISLLLAASGH